MKSKEQKRKEAIERANEKYTIAETFNWKYFLEKYPYREDYLSLFRESNVKISRRSVLSELDLVINTLD